MLKAENLSKNYMMHGSPITVLKNAELSVAKGTSLAIIGKSGSGKSTLLHVLGGLDKPKSGEVFIDGKPLYLCSSAARTRLRAEKIGFVFQAYHLLPEMDIIENVMLPSMTLGKISKKERYNRAVELLEQVGLNHRLHHTPLELSGGEQQRAAIARALMNQPPLLLADEPTGNLDRTTGDQVLQLLFDLCSANGQTLIMVTHSPETAARCNRMLTLADGKLQ